MAYSDLRFFPTTEELNTQLLDPTDFSGAEKVTGETSELMKFTAESVCTTCSHAEMCTGNGKRGFYVHCQNPNSPFGTHHHNALQGCGHHSK